MRVVLLGAATLLLSACGSGHVCPMYRIADGISFDATAYVTAHPAAAKLCLAPGACQPIDHVTIGADGPGTEHLDLTVTTASGTVLLHQTASVRVRYINPDPGCDNGADRGLVTIAADGSVTTS